MHQTPEQDISARATRITLIAPALLVGYGLTMPWLLLHYYVRPYQVGTGLLTAAGHINWQYAEPWFALGPAVLHVPLGLLAWVVIRRRYSPGKTPPTTAANFAVADNTST